MKRTKKNMGIMLVQQENRATVSGEISSIMNMCLEWIFISMILYGAVTGLFVTCGAPSFTLRGFLTMSLIAAITVLIFSLRKPLFIVIYFAVSLAFLAFYFNVLVEGAKNFASYYLPAINEYCKTNLKISAFTGVSGIADSITCFQIFLGWGVVVLICTGRKIYKRSLVALISPILLFALNFVVGLVPESKYLFAFLFGFLPLSLTIKGEDAVVGIQAKLTTLISMGILALMCVTILPEAVYQDNLLSIYSFKKDIQDIRNSDFLGDILYQFTDIDFLSGSLFSFGSGGLSDGVLGEKDKIKYNGKTDFVLKTSLGNVNNRGNSYELYLRSFIGSNYSNKIWGDLDDEEQDAYDALVEECDYNFENLITDFFKLGNIFNNGIYVEENMGFKTITIEKKDIGKKHMLLPYGVNDDVLSRNGYLYTQDSYGKKNYTEEVIANALLEPFYGVNAYDSERYIYNQQFVFNLYNLQYEYNLESAYIGDDDQSTGQADAKIHITSDPEIYTTGDPESYMSNISGGLSVYGEYSQIDSITPPKEEFQQFFRNEEKYRKFVYDTYTKVPEDVAPQLQKELSDMKLFGSQYYFEGQYSEGYVDEQNLDLTFLLMEECKDFLCDHATYSLEPGFTPEGKDFIDYFLYENKKGYCSYFATAAVIYLRLHGVPARYAEGYKVTTRDLNRAAQIEVDDETQYRLSVTDEMAHAWVEVYISGAGWIAYDPTPGRGTDGIEKTTLNSDNSTTTQPGGNAIAPSLIPPTVSPQILNNTKEPQSSSSTGLYGNEGNGKGLVAINRTIRIIITVIICLIFIVVAILVRRSILIERHRRKERCPENNTKVKYYYWEINRIIHTFARIHKDEELEQCLEKIEDVSCVADVDNLREMIIIVERASFGEKQVSDYECMKVKVLYHNLRNEMYKNSSFIKTLYYKVWKVL